MMTTVTGIIAWIKLNWVLVMFVALLAGAFIFLRTEASAIDNSQELAGLLVDGRPTVLEFYSNF